MNKEINKLGNSSSNISNQTKDFSKKLSITIASIILLNISSCSTNNDEKNDNPLSPDTTNTTPSLKLSEFAITLPSYTAGTAIDVSLPSEFIQDGTTNYIVGLPNGITYDEANNKLTGTLEPLDGVVSETNEITFIKVDEKDSKNTLSKKVLLTRTNTVPCDIEDWIGDANEVDNYIGTNFGFSVVKVTNPVNAVLYINEGSSISDSIAIIELTNTGIIVDVEATLKRIDTNTGNKSNPFKMIGLNLAN